jgi:hypothetical protein
MKKRRPSLLCVCGHELSKHSREGAGVCGVWKCVCFYYREGPPEYKFDWQRLGSGAMVG